MHDYYLRFQGAKTVTAPAVFAKNPNIRNAYDEYCRDPTAAQCGASAGDAILIQGKKFAKTRPS